MLYKSITCLLLLGLLSIPTAYAASCDSQGIVLQVLGSGGPIADDARASSSYLIWQDRQARAMIDIGGGSILRFAESGASIEDLDAIAITHTHVDHIGDLPALIKSGLFSTRQRPLALLGPDGSDLYPSISEYINSTFLTKQASHRYLSGIGTGRSGLFQLATTEIPRTLAAREWLSAEHLSISAVGVKHAIVPAVGYVINIDNQRIAIPGDMSVNNQSFIDLARGSDILVLHLAIPETATGNLPKLHARPSEMGQLAAAIQPRQLVISHIMQRAERGLDQHLKNMKKHYKGPIHIANDLACYPAIDS